MQGVVSVKQLLQEDTRLGNPMMEGLRDLPCAFAVTA